MRIDKRPTGSKIWIGSVLAAFVAAVAIFMVMLHMEKKVLSEYERGSIYVAKKEIPKGVVLEGQNLEEYLRLESLDVKLVPPTALENADQISGLIACNRIEEGVLLTEGMFEAQSKILKDMEKPVIAGFRAEDLYQVVGGVLRAGDRIHIYTVSELGQAGLVWENVFVEQVFDSGGKSIKGDDTTSSAQRINVYLDAEDVERFYTELAHGALRVVKVCE